MRVYIHQLQLQLGLKLQIAMREERTPTSLSPAQQSQEKPNWRVSFGFWTELDALYRSFPPPTKPRCPALPRDSAAEWEKRLVPDAIEQFLGNPSAAACLRAITNSTETDTTPAFTNFIISGGHCTGKSTFAGILKKALLSVTSEQPCQFATINSSEYVDRVLPSKLEDTVQRLDASKSGTPSFLIIDRFESVTPSVQQHFFVPLLAVANQKKIFVILLVRPDVNKLAEQVKTQALKVHLQPLSANLVRTKLLLICQQERIGYTQEGLEELAKLCSFKLMPCLEKLHDIFLKQYFISQANVVKVGQPASGSSNALRAVPPFPLPIMRMNDPLRRCPKCTLLPPCSHISLQNLYLKIDQIRARYPKNGRKPDASRVDMALETNPKPENAAFEVPTPSATEHLVCPSFDRRGICANIQKLGRCRYAHPLDLHTIDTTALVSRCRIHTLPLPCLHCSNAEQQKVEAGKEVALCEQLKRELLRSRHALTDLETQRYMIARDSGKTAKWGGAKKAADEQLSRMDASIASAQTSIKRQEQELSSHLETLEKLQDSIAHGRSCGLGKGHGRIELKQYEKLQRKAAVVAAV